MADREFELDDNYDEDDDTMESIYLTFALEERDYGLEVRHVIEIVGLPAVTAVPDMPNFVKGIINLRGRVIPVMDMRLRFRIPETEYHDRTCVIIVNLNERLAGLIVDAVREVYRIPADQMEPAPRMGNMAGSRYIKAVGKVGDEVKLILDIDHLINEDELTEIEAAGKNSGVAEEKGRNSATADSAGDKPES